MGEWRQVRIGDFLHRVKQPVKLRDDADYSLVTVKMHHNGVVLRESKKGKLIGSNMYRVKSGQFILSGIDARNGAFGVIPEKLDGAIVTNDFWYFDVDEAVVSRDFFLWLTTTPLFLDACIKSSEGTTNRRRLQGDKFFNFEFHFPEIGEQKRLAERFNAVDLTFAAMKGEFEQQSEYLKQLRQAVLQEAVKGKLTAEWRKQHPAVKGDPQHDAAALLAQIKAEKERLVKEGNIRKEKPLPPIADVDKPFGLPDGWVWCRLGEVGVFARGKSKHRPRNDESLFKDGRYPFVQTGDVSQSKYSNFVISSYAKCYNDTGLRQSHLWTKGTLCITIAANIAETGFLGIDACFPDSVVGFRSVSGDVTPKFIRFFLNQAQERIIKFAPATAQKNINLDIIGSLIFPLPPLAEQQAIVARIDSLMAVIDTLEKQVAERKEQAQLLMQTVLREAFDGNAEIHQKRI